MKKLTRISLKGTQNLTEIINRSDINALLESLVKQKDDIRAFVGIVVSNEGNIRVFKNAVNAIKLLGLLRYAEHEIIDSEFELEEDECDEEGT